MLFRIVVSFMFFCVNFFLIIGNFEIQYVFIVKIIEMLGVLIFFIDEKVVVDEYCCEELWELGFFQELDLFQNVWIGFFDVEIMFM